MMEAEIKENTENKQKKRWKRTLFGVITLFVVAGGAFVFWLFNSSATGTVRVVEQGSAQKEKTELPPERFEGKYVSFLHPAAYDVREVQPDVVSVEKGLFVASGGSSRLIAFAVQDMEGKTLADIPSYQLRSVVKKDEYERSERKTEKFDATIFTKSKEGYERTAFILHGGILVTLSVSSQVFSDPKTIDEDFETIFNSLEFVN